MEPNHSTIPPICVLHIGKTGGSFLRSVLKHNQDRWTLPLNLLGHEATAFGTAKRFGPDRQLAFVVRDPLLRFSSGFYSRQRQGRPTYQSDWTAEEAAAFRWFETPEDLALALASPKEVEKSAALFAFNSIRHLKSDLRHHLGGARRLVKERDNIIMCVDLPDLTALLPMIMTTLGVPDWDMPPNPVTHKSPTPPAPLTAQATAALRAHWADEFEVYDVVRDMAYQLGFSR